jgi:hypothetical protein
VTATAAVTAAVRIRSHERSTGDNYRGRGGLDSVVVIFG